jgi:hypothetical protein
MTEAVDPAVAELTISAETEVDGDRSGRARPRDRPARDRVRGGCARARRVGVPHRPLQLGWWTWAFPAILLALLLVCVNLVGDEIDAALNPASRR